MVAMATLKVPRVPLGNTGMQVSIFGMGCSPLGHSYGVRMQHTGRGPPVLQLML